MAIRKISFAPKEYFHIYNRGNDKRQIFNDSNDYRHFLELLYLSNSRKNFVIRDIDTEIYSVDRGKQLVAIGAYCAMPNHFHILITPLEEGGLSKFMQKLTTGLSMYYNRKYSRTGSLFEGRFKAEHASDDSYLKYLFSYIHLNPIKLLQSDWKEEGIQDLKKARDYLKKYYFSSYPDYFGEQRAENIILNRENFPGYFPDKNSFEHEITDWITTEVRPM